MQIKLIPVIEITNYDQGIEMPKSGSSLEFPEEWDLYHQQCNLQAGFLDDLIPYKKGLSFYEFSAISHYNLKILILKETFELRENNDECDYIMPFNGGCILNVDGEDLHFPQCCCDLSSFSDYEKLAFSKDTSFYQGHPTPRITIENNEVIFDFDSDEVYYPSIKKEKVIIPIEDLQKAIIETKRQFQEFASRVLKIELEENLGIQKLDSLLVWGE